VVGCPGRALLVVAGLVGVVKEKLEEVGGTGQPAQGQRAEFVVRVVVTVLDREDVGDPVDQRVEPGGVAGGGAGDDVAIAVLVGTRDADVAAVSVGFA